MTGDGGDRTWLGLYVLLALVFVLSFGPVAAGPPERYVLWNMALFGVAVAALAGALLVTRRSKVDAADRLMQWASGLYAGLIVVNGLIHWWATHRMPGSWFVNVSGLKAAVWQYDIVKFSVFYLFFPLLLVLHLVLLRRVGRRAVVHCLAAATLANLAVQGYQVFVDPSWLNRAPWIGLERFGGLSTDPNALALIGFLLLPLFVHAAVTSGSRGVAALYGLLTVAVVAAIGFSGSRTGAGGLFLLAAALPLAVAAVRRDWSRRRRLLLALAPVVILLAAFALAPPAARLAQRSELGVLGGRLLGTWERYRAEGVAGVFFVNEVRGRHYVHASDLLSEAPIAGWGPGGFYREFPNQWFHGTGAIEPAQDSALNHYLMVGCDLGLVTLAVNLLLMLAPLGLAMAALPRITEPSERLLVVAVTAANLVFLLMIITIPPSNFADVIWVWTAELAWLLIIGGRYLGAGVATARSLRVAGLAASSLLVGAVAFGAYGASFGELGYQARHRKAWWPHDQMAGYGPESWPEGKGRWSGSRAFVKIPLSEPEPGEVVVKVKASNPDIGEKPVTLRYGGPQGVSHELMLADSQWHEIVIPVSSEYRLQANTPNRPTRFLGISLEVSRTWVPQEWGLGDDRRQLGVAYLLPEPRRETD